MKKVICSLASLGLLLLTVIAPLALAGTFVAQKGSGTIQCQRSFNSNDWVSCPFTFAPEKGALIVRRDGSGQVLMPDFPSGTGWGYFGPGSIPLTETSPDGGLHVFVIAGTFNGVVLYSSPGNPDGLLLSGGGQTCADGSACTGEFEVEVFPGSGPRGVHPAYLLNGMLTLTDGPATSTAPQQSTSTNE